MTFVRVTVDGVTADLRASGATSLLRSLRSAGIQAVKGACEQGECGSCTVVLDGGVVCSCLVPAAVCDGAVITTAAGVHAPALAEALARHAAVQCGFCTPGIVVAADAYLRAGGAADRRAVAEALEGNLCRCTGYHGIVDAVVEVARALQDARTADGKPT